MGSKSYHPKAQKIVGMLNKKGRKIVRQPNEVRASHSERIDALVEEMRARVRASRL